MRYTQALAQFIADTDFASLPQPVVDRAKLIIADTIGVTIRGAAEPEMTRLAACLPGGAGAVLLCAGFRSTDPPVAAWYNASAGCVLELDEGCPPTGHPAIHVLPVVLGAAQKAGRSGRDALLALVIGYEVQARLQRACHLRTPVHPHGNMGHVGAVAALAKLERWTPDQIEQGILIASSLASASSWGPCFSGSTVRNVYAGTSAQSAFNVGFLVRSGFTGHELALEDTFGEILGDRLDPSILLERLGSDYVLMGSYFKFHAACGYVHPVIEALIDALNVPRRQGEFPQWKHSLGLTPEDIDAVEMQVSAPAMRLAVAPERTPLSAKFSLAFGAATFLMRGASDGDAFGADAISDRRIWNLLSRISIVGAEPSSSSVAAQDSATVRIRFNDGRIVSGECHAPFGAASNPASAHDVRGKFMALTAGLLPGPQQEGLWELAVRLPDVKSLADFPDGIAMTANDS